MREPRNSCHDSLSDISQVYGLHGCKIEIPYSGVYCTVSTPLSLTIKGFSYDKNTWECKMFLQHLISLTDIV